VNKKNTGVQEFRSSGVQEFRSSGVQEFRSSGVQEFRILLKERYLFISEMSKVRSHPWQLTHFKQLGVIKYNWSFRGLGLGT
jgi:hypothetical protein